MKGRSDIITYHILGRLRPFKRLTSTRVVSQCTALRGRYRAAHQFLQAPIGYQIWPCRKIGQGQPRIIIWTNYDGQESLMPHTKFHGNRSIGSREEDFWRVFTIYGHGSHLGHVTSIMSINFHFLVLESLHTKFGFDWPSGFWEKQVLSFVC